MIPADLWDELAGEASGTPSGVLARRLRPDDPQDLYVAIERPSNCRMLLLGISTRVAESIREVPKAEGLEVRPVSNPSDPSRASLRLVLTSERYLDLFETVVADLVPRIAPLADEKQAVAVFLGRIKKWMAFLKQHGNEGLGPQARTGLFGELWLLRHYMIPTLGLDDAVGAWTGPGGTPQDFQMAGRSVEVKATTTKQHHKIHVANERQLDETVCGSLLLAHLSLEERHDGGETLPDLVSSIRTIVATSPSALEAFEASLLDAGYVDMHDAIYRTSGYAHRKSQFFQVSGSFPRIREGDLGRGIGDVSYTVMVSACEAFSLGEAEAIALIGGTGD